MGKPTGKKKSEAVTPKGDTPKTPKENKKKMNELVSPRGGETPGKFTKSYTSKAFDEDTAIFINMSQELKEEGNRLFQRRDNEGAMLKYEKALKLLPKNHIDVAYLRTNIAICYMQMGLGEYPRAINECNLALEVSPKYSKALLKRASCYEALNRLDLAWRDVNHVLTMEPGNAAGLEILESVKKVMEEKGITFDENELRLVDDVVPAGGSVSKFRKVVNEKVKKKKRKSIGGPIGNNKIEEQDKVVKDKNLIKEQDKIVKDKNVVKTIKDEEVVKKTIPEEKKTITKGVKEHKMITKDVKEETIITKTVKLVYGEDIRWAQLPINCSIRLVRDIVRDRFPSLKGVLVKYRDSEGDLITITTTDELRMAESTSEKQASLRLYISEVTPDQEPAYDGMENEVDVDNAEKKPLESGKIENVEGLTCVEDWIVQFARLFKNHVGFDSDSYLDLHELGMKLYSEAMEDSVTCDEAQRLFDIAADKFQEMAALALLNLGNVHLSKARKRLFLPEDSSRESMLEKAKDSYQWAKKEYVKSEKRYEDALKIKPDFYEAYLALAQQQFEQAKLCWYNAIGSQIDLESGPSEEILALYNKAEDSMDKGMLMWEEIEERRLNGISKFDEYKVQLKKMGLDGLVKELSSEDAAEQAANMSSQIYLLWGTLLYERSVVEYKLELPTWEECLEVSIEKFELAGASPTDIAVMLKNHCSNETALEGLGFKIDEIIQAWNEMYDAKRWQIGVPSFRLEPLFRRRVPKLHEMLEHV
ncbi:hypothetical protein ACFE04_013479 [Oxalis oulophora]